MDISRHKIWDKVAGYKKPAHMARFFLARNFAKLYPRSLFIGITGSVGKTTTARACVAVLAQKYKTLSTSMNLDTVFNIPITILKIRPKTQKVVLEMGVEYPGEMDFYLSMARPATAIVTRVSFAHSEFLGGIEDILKEKGQLVKQLPDDGFAILNGDDLNVRKLAQETKAQVIFFGTEGGKLDVKASHIRFENNKTKFEINYGVERVEVTSKLLGKHYVYACLAAAALGLTCDMSLFNIKKGLEELEPADHRLQLKTGLNGFMVIDDTHNSSPAALEEAINVLNEMSAKRRILVLGEMRELGSYSEKLHRLMAQKIYKEKIDFVLLSGGDARFIGDELVKLGYPADHLEVNLTNPQIVSKILTVAGKGDMVLVKGSHAVRLDEVVNRVIKQNT